MHRCPERAECSPEVLGARIPDGSRPREDRLSKHEKFVKELKEVGEEVTEMHLWSNSLLLFETVWSSCPRVPA